MRKRVGIFGGSFNPVHTGHMIVASYIAGWTDIDEVWLTLSPENPLKRRHDGATDADRLSMLRTACGNSDTLKVCDVELGMPRPSYTEISARQIS